MKCIGSTYKNISKTRDVLWKIFLVFDILSLALILLFSIADTQNNLSVSKMIILPFVWGIPFVIVYFLRDCLTVFLSKISKYAFPCFLFWYGMGLFWICTREKFEFLHDQQMVYQGALYVAGLAEEINWEYFARCNNNVIPMLILGIVLKIGNSIGMDAPHYLGVGINVLQVLIAMACLFAILKKKTQYGILMAWLGTGMLAICIPIIGQTMSVYTDSMSFSFSILAIFMWMKYEDYRQDKRLKSMRAILYLIGVGCLMGVAVSIKITTAIPVIAFLLCGILLGRNDDRKAAGRNKENAFYWLIIPCVMACVFLVLSWYTTTLPCEALRDSYGTPKVSYWIGIGLKGNGGYVDNQEYSYMLNTIYGMDEKEAWSRQYILENAREFVNPNHIISKLRYNFANGRLGAGDFMLWGQSQNFWANVMSSEGAYFWRFSMINTSYIYFIYWCVLFHAVSGLCRKGRPERIDAISLVSVFGIMLYVMLFEANNRQLYNHLPWLILAAVTGIYELFLWFDKRSISKISCRENG